MENGKTPAGLYALTVGAFAIGSTEFVPMGLLPPIASDLHVSIPQAGFLITGYAISVALGAPLLTVIFNNRTRKTSLLVLLGLFIIGNALAAVAQNYDVLLAARIITALCHGSFFGIGSIVAASLVPKERSAAALSTMLTGLTLATVLGVPFGAFIGDRFGWHVPFALIALLGVLAFAGIFAVVPREREDAPDLGSELGVLLSPRVLVSLLSTILGFAGVFTLFTYIAPLLEHVSGFSPEAVAMLLVVFGVGTTAGNIVAGKYTDRFLPLTLIVSLIGLCAVLALSPVAWPHPPLAIATTFLVGFFGFGTVTPLQMLVLRSAGGSATLASSANVAAFNIGNAFGAALGGGIIAVHLPLSTIGPAGAVVTAAGIAAVLLTLRLLANAPESSPHHAHGESRPAAAQ